MTARRRIDPAALDELSCVATEFDDLSPMCRGAHHCHRTGRWSATTRVLAAAAATVGITAFVAPVMAAAAPADAPSNRTSAPTSDAPPLPGEPPMMMLDAVPDGFVIHDVVLDESALRSGTAVLLGWSDPGVELAEGEPAELLPVLVVAGPYVDRVYREGLPSARTVEVDGVTGSVGGTHYDTAARIEVGDHVVSVLIAGAALTDEELVGIGAALADPERLAWAGGPPAGFVELGRREFERGPGRQVEWHRGGETLWVTSTLDMHFLSEGTPPRVTATPVSIDGLSGFMFTQDGSGATSRWLSIRMADGTVTTLMYDNMGGPIDTVDLVELFAAVRPATDDEVAAFDDEGLLTVWSDS